MCAIGRRSERQTHTIRFYLPLGLTENSCVLRTLTPHKTFPSLLFSFLLFSPPFNVRQNHGIPSPTVPPFCSRTIYVNPRLSASPDNHTPRTRMAPLLFDPFPFFSSSSFTVDHAGHDRQIYQAHTQSHRSSWCHFELVVPRMHRMKSPSKRHASPGSHPSQTSSTQASSTMINFTSKGRHIFRPKLFPPVSDCAASPKAEDQKRKWYYY
jgi:hypothetical protein